MFMCSVLFYYLQYGNVLYLVSNMECSVGKFLKENCHKSDYGESKNVIDLSSLDESSQELIRLRVNTPNVSSLCDYHKVKMLEKYNHLYGTNCCDPLNVHKKSIKKSLREITLQKREEALLHNIDLIPGKALCTNCWTKIRSLDTNEESSASFEPIVEKLENINTVCETLGESPLKLSKLSSEKRKHGIKSKVEKISKKLKRNLMESYEISDDESNNTEQSQDDYNNDLISKLKEKMKTAKTVQDKVTILSLLPPNWTIKRTVTEFEVSEYLAKKTKNLVKKYGILPKVDERKPKTFCENTKIKIQQFYENDENSRVCPGIKDCLSIHVAGIKTHKQKRLILCNIKELYSKFKTLNSDVKVGFSKFAQLRPKWCVLAGPKGTHNVCVCMIHQNVKLMVNAVKGYPDYKNMLELMVCNIQAEECMMGQCKDCPGSSPVKEILEQFNDPLYEDEVTEIVKYQQWVTVDRCELMTICKPYDEFKERLVEQLMNLKKHHFIAKKQSEFIKFKKSNLQSEECVIIGDFSENFTFVIQDEVQSFHWVNSQATLHPFMLYCTDPDNPTQLKSKSFCVISDCLTHTTATFYSFQKQLLSEVKNLCPNIKKINYFSDGCAGQYKNKKNFINLCHHKSDFGVEAEWHFFATSHGKTACDGVGGTVKRLVSKASLQKTAEPIITPTQMYEYCKTNITGIQFIYVSESDIKKEMLEERFAKAIPNTRQLHAFIPLNECHLKVACTSFSTESKVCSIQENQTVSLKENDYACCVYDSKWWLGRVEEILKEEHEYRILFFHPAGPTTSFKLSQNDYSIVPERNILRKISPLELSLATTGRGHNISTKLSEELSVLLCNHISKCKS